MRPSSGEMEDVDWNEAGVRSLGMGLVGHQIPETDEYGEAIAGDSFLLLFNAHHEDVEFLANRFKGRDWEVILDTAQHLHSPRTLTAAHSARVAARSMQVLKFLSQQGKAT